MVERSYPEVSVIIPTFNRARLLPRAIDSVLAQTCAPDQILVVDDGSTDETRQVLERYGDRIQALRQENRGAASARNRGLQHAWGHWLAFLDSDDVWLPRKLEVQLEALRETGARLCFTSAVIDGDPPSAGESPRGSDARAWEVADPALALVLDEGHPTYLPTLIAERALVQEAGGFDETLRVAEDTKLVVWLAMRAKAVYVHEPLVRIDRSHERGGLITDDLEAWKDRTRGGIHVLEMALAGDAAEGALGRIVRRQLADTHATLAGLHCLESRWPEARRCALDALRHGGDARTRLKSLAALLVPRLLARELGRRRRRSS
jgi:glycosyltransferase involved in cell wall biosynthesis